MPGTGTVRYYSTVLCGAMCVPFCLVLSYPKRLQPIHPPIHFFPTTPLPIPIPSLFHPHHLPMPIIRTAAKLIFGTAATSAGGLYLLTRDTHFVPYTATTDPSLGKALKLYNPHNNPPTFASHAVQQVPLSRLSMTDNETLIRSFCSGVWAGSGYMCQRKILEMKHRHLEGREGMLWDKGELENAEYGVGSIITDHFEVVERGNDKVPSSSSSSSSPAVCLPNCLFGIDSMDV